MSVIFPLLIYLPVFFQHEAQAFLDKNLIKDYFNLKGLSRLVIFSCDSKLVHSSLLKYLWDINGMPSTIYNTEHFQFELNEILLNDQAHFGIALNGECQSSKVILKQSAKYQKFDEKYHWLIFSVDNGILDVLSNITINVNAEITVALPIHGAGWTLLDVYNPGFDHGGTLKITDMGLWHMERGFQINDVMMDWKYWRRRNMSEVTFKGTIVLTKNFSGRLEEYLYYYDNNRSVDTWSRYQFSLWVYIQEFYNFNLEINMLHLWGKELPNGSFSGLMGALQRKDTDIGLSAVFVKRQRVRVVDFLTHTFIMRSCFIFRQPKPPVALQGAFFNPLSRAVWCCTWAVLFIISLLIGIILKQEAKFSGTNEDYMEHSCSYIGLMVLGELCQQDIPKIANSYSGRIAMFTLILFTYILYQFYSDSIVSSLLMETPTLIHDLKDLLNSSLKIGIEDIPYERDFFELTTDPVAIDLYNYKVAGKKNGSDAFYEPNAGLELVEKGGFAFQVDTPTAYKIIADTFPNSVICELGEINLFPTQKTIGVIQQNSPFRELFTYGFQRLTEAGIVLRQRYHWQASRPACIKIVDASKINVGLDEFGPALLFLGTGIIISLLILCVELFMKYKQRKNNSVSICNSKSYYTNC